MKFSELAEFFTKIENTASRLTITNLLAELFKKLNASEIEKTTYLLQGRVAPIYEKIESGMAEKMVIRSILFSLGIDKETFMKEFEKSGDLGTTVEFFKKKKEPTDKGNLTILAVYNELRRLATSGGHGSQEIKVKTLSDLIRNLDALSCRYLVRIPIGTMRLGFSDMTVLDSYSWMIAGDKSLRKIIEETYHVRPDLGHIGKVLKEEGVKGLKHTTPLLFTPILMMRAERLISSEEIVEKIGKCSVEPKYDGFRLQIHYNKKKNEVRLYSRNLEEVSFMYPDISEGVKREIKADEIIFEGEAIGFDPQTGSFLPFQETVQRKRKYGIEEKAKEIPLKFFSFELLYLDGQNYLHIPFYERRNKLVQIVDEGKDIYKDTIFVADNTITGDAKKIELLFDEAITKGLEGVVAKKLDGIYQAGARGWNWIKFKRSYSSKIEDTIDCLVMGYDYGRGKRASFGMGAFLVGVYDEKMDKFVTVAKIGTGLSDEEWKELKVRSEKVRSSTKPALYKVDRLMGVDVWVKPVFVVEIKADEITRSPIHTAGRLMKVSKGGHAQEVDIAGFALRFPRLIRFRDDRRPEDVTSLKEVESMYKASRK